MARRLTRPPFVGTSLEGFLRERSVAPLDTNDTSFSVPASKLHRLVGSYWTNLAPGELEVADAVGDYSWWASLP